MNLLWWYIIIALGGALLVWSFALFVLVRKKRRSNVGSGLNLALFLVTVPEPRIEQGSQEEQLKNFIAHMEQFLAGLATIRRSGVGARLLGHPTFALEIAAHNKGDDVFFYVAFPRIYATVLRNQLHGAFPDAHIEQVPDYNIFHPAGASAMAVLRQADSPLIPAKTYRTLAADPLETITSAFSKLKGVGEGAAIQIVLRVPVKNPASRFRNVIMMLREGKSRSSAFGKKTIAKEIASLLSFSQKTDPAGRQPAIDDAAIKLLEEKSAKLLFECNVRLVSSGETGESADRILRELEAAFLQFQNPDGNLFKPRELRGRAFYKGIEAFSFRLFDEHYTMLLNVEELASMYHLPFSRKSAPMVRMLKAKEATPPPNLPRDGIVIGKSAFRGESQIIRIAKEDRMRHLYMVGQTGTGKSTLLENIIIQDIRNGEGVAVLDPHGELIEKILPLIPKERVEDVIHFNPGDTAYPMGLNMLEYDPRYPEYKSLVINELLEIFNKLFNMSIAGGPQFEQYFRNAAALVMEDPESGSTALEIRRIFSDKAFRDYKLSRCKNIVVSTFWREIAEKSTGEQSLANMTAYVVSKFDVFLSNDIMRPIILQQHSAFNFREAMDTKKILFVNLAKGKLGEINSNLIGLIVVGKILISALSRTDVPEHERGDFYLTIDEFQNVTTKSISTILSEARKYRLGMTVAHQFLAQLEEEIKKSVFGNVGSILAFRVGADDAEYLEKIFAPVFSAHDLTNIDNANAYFKPLIHGLTVKPFNIKTFPRETGDPLWAESIKQISRLKYARPREEVEKEIHERYSAL